MANYVTAWTNVPKEIADKAGIIYKPGIEPIDIDFTVLGITDREAENIRGVDVYPQSNPKDIGFTIYSKGSFPTSWFRELAKLTDYNLFVDLEGEVGTYELLQAKDGVVQDSVWIAEEVYHDCITKRIPIEEMIQLSNQKAEESYEDFMSRFN